MAMFNPPHPGETLREDVIPALGLTISEVAEHLAVTRAALSRVINGRAAISPEMALRLEKWLGPQRGGSADAWLAQQAAYDLWRARKQSVQQLRAVRRLPRPKAPLQPDHDPVAA